MSATASSLLDIMSFRLSMIDDGKIHPHQLVTNATRQLVKRLSELSPEETIIISYDRETLHAQYIREASGEVLAEIHDVGNI